MGLLSKNNEVKILNIKTTKVKVQVKTNNDNRRIWLWAVKILIITFILSLCFSMLSELLLSNTSIVISVFLLIPLFVIAVISDMVGIAVAACPLDYFKEQLRKKVRGAKEALILIRNAEKVSSICNDVIGDVCSIISGAVGASIVIKIIKQANYTSENIIIASLVSAMIAALTVFGKALGKKFAISSSKRFVGFCGRFLSLFTKKIK